MDMKNCGMCGFRGETAGLGGKECMKERRVGKRDSALETIQGPSLQRFEDIYCCPSNGR